MSLLTKLQNVDLFAPRHFHQHRCVSRGFQSLLRAYKSRYLFHVLLPKDLQQQHLNTQFHQGSRNQVSANLCNYLNQTHRYQTHFFDMTLDFGRHKELPTRQLIADERSFVMHHRRQTTPHATPNPHAGKTPLESSNAPTTRDDR